MGIYNSLEHASHNEKVCNYLSEENEFSDWVITTAFYSSIHFLRHKIFPLEFKVNGKKQKAENFETYCKLTEKTSRKHNTMRKLVEDHCPGDISAAYNQLMDSCWAARYSQYKFSLKVAQTSKKRMVAIRNYSK